MMWAAFKCIRMGSSGELLCEHGRAPLGSIEGREFSKYLRDFPISILFLNLQLTDDNVVTNELS
jgi:hypothetical protein